jgi:uncharacterized membrane protein YvbJ
MTLSWAICIIICEVVCIIAAYKLGQMQAWREASDALEDAIKKWGK